MEGEHTAVAMVRYQFHQHAPNASALETQGGCQVPPPVLSSEHQWTAPALAEPALHRRRHLHLPTVVHHLNPTISWRWAAVSQLGNLSESGFDPKAKETPALLAFNCIDSRILQHNALLFYLSTHCQENWFRREKGNLIWGMEGGNEVRTGLFQNQVQTA